MNEPSCLHSAYAADAANTSTSLPLVTIPRTAENRNVNTDNTAKRFVVDVIAFRATIETVGTIDDRLNATTEVIRVIVV